VPSKHKEAHAFLKKGFFEGLKSIRDFEMRTERLANTKEVGDAFEILVEAYLYLNPGIPWFYLEEIKPALVSIPALPRHPPSKICFPNTSPPMLMRVFSSTT